MIRGAKISLKNVRDWLQFEPLFEYALAAAGYSALTAVMTFPLILSLDNAVPGGPGDATAHIWTFWWFRKAIVDLHENPLYTDYMFYPVGTSLLLGDVQLLNPLAGALLQSFGMSPQSAYDLIVFSSFVLTGISAYLLCKLFATDRVSCFVGGSMFAFSPFRLARGLGHLSLLSTQWFVLFTFFFLKTLREPRDRNGLLAAIFLILTIVGSSYYYDIFMLLFMALILVIHRKEALVPRFRRAFLAMVATSVVLVSPYAYAVMNTISVNPLSYLFREAPEILYYSADLTGFFVPSSLHPLFGPISSQISKGLSGNQTEYTAYLGYTGIALSVIALQRRNVKGVRFWWATAVVFSILALGPVLHVLGNSSFTDFLVSIPLPFILLYYALPFMRIVRTPNRFSVLSILAVSVLSAVALQSIRESISCHGKTKSAVATSLIFALILFEFLAIPYPMTQIAVPAFYGQIASEKDDFAIIEIPMEITAQADLYLYYQTFHQKRLIGGEMGRARAVEDEFIRNTPIISDLILASREGDILRQNSPEIASSVLGYYRVRYVILHKDLATPENVSALSSRMQLWGLVVAFEDSSLRVFRVPQMLELKAFAILGQGWFPVGIWRSSDRQFPVRWMGQSASIVVINPSPKFIPVNFEFSALSFAVPRELSIISNGTKLAELRISSDQFTRYQVPSLWVAPTSKLIIEFHATSPIQSPPRIGTVAFYEISITYSILTAKKAEKLDSGSPLPPAMESLPIALAYGGPKTYSYGQNASRVYCESARPSSDKRIHILVSEGSD